MKKWAKKTGWTDHTLSFAYVVEGVHGIRLVEGKVALGKDEVLGNGLVPLLTVEVHLGISTVSHGQGEAEGQPCSFDEDSASGHRHHLGAIHGHRELCTAMSRRRHRK